jgi:hypothetical protein
MIIIESCFAHNELMAVISECRGSDIVPFSPLEAVADNLCDNSALALTQNLDSSFLMHEITCQYAGNGCNLPSKIRRLSAAILPTKRPGKAGSTPGLRLASPLGHETIGPMTVVQPKRMSFVKLMVDTQR